MGNIINNLIKLINLKLIHNLIKVFLESNINRKALYFLAGLLSGICFAPYFFIPGWFGVSFLVYGIYYEDNKKLIFYKSLIFGFGYFLSGIYWISIGVAVYIDQFWWMIPIALLGLPFFLGIFIAILSLTSSYFKLSEYYFTFIFSLFWVLFEILRSNILTGFEWNIASHSVGFSLYLSQIVSFIGLFGLSYLIIFIFSGLLLFKYKKNYISHIYTSFFIILFVICFGVYRVINTPLEYTNITVRLVQPNILQNVKWDHNQHASNIKKHEYLSLNNDINNKSIKNEYKDKINLSKNIYKPDIIIWPESAVTYLLNSSNVLEYLGYLSETSKAILITGGITKHDEDVYVSMIGVDENSKIRFEYNKAHLVPFGEYVPFSNFLNISKITKGFKDFSFGSNNSLVELNIKSNIYAHNDNIPKSIIANTNNEKLRIIPLICFESIFAEEVRKKNNNADLIINITNDAWYGNSSGPYQHFYISKFRAIENSIPMIRVSNNGISAVIDSIGRILQKSDLNQSTKIDSYIPKKLTNTNKNNFFDFKIINLKYGYIIMLILTIISVLILKKAIFKVL